MLEEVVEHGDNAFRQERVHKERLDLCNEKEAPSAVLLPSAFHARKNTGPLPEVRKAKVPMVSLDMMLWKRANCPNICKLASFSRRTSADRLSHSPRSFSICWILILLRYCREICNGHQARKRICSWMPKSHSLLMQPSSEVPFSLEIYRFIQGRLQHLNHYIKKFHTTHRNGGIGTGSIEVWCRQFSGRAMEVSWQPLSVDVEQRE